MHKSAIAVLTVLLAACGGTEDPSPKEVDVAVANASAQAEAVKNAAEPSPAPVPAATPTVAEIPMAFHGRWGMVPADCDPARADAKGLIEIDTSSLKFYESRARLTEVTEDSPENFTGTFAFSGEGQEWTKSENLKLSGSSNTLIRTENDPQGSFTYRRCS